MIRTVFVACVVLSAVLSSATRASAQDIVTLSGRLLNSLSGDPIPGVVVVIEELGRHHHVGRRRYVQPRGRGPEYLSPVCGGAGLLVASHRSAGRSASRFAHRS